MMDATMSAGMREATHLTRAGQLLEAIAIIQRTLHGLSGPKPAANTPEQQGIRRSRDASVSSTTR